MHFAGTESSSNTLHKTQLGNRVSHLVAIAEGTTFVKSMVLYIILLSKCCNDATILTEKHC